METSALTLLVVQLMAALAGLTGHPVPDEVPAVEFMPQAALARKACGGPCRVQGWYGGERVIYLDDRLAPETSLWDRSILVHELIHYMQERDGAFGVTPTCERWIEREREAYDAQREWLAVNAAPGKSPRFPRISRLRVVCDR